MCNQKTETFLKSNDRYLLNVVIDEGLSALCDDLIKSVYL